MIRDDQLQPQLLRRFGLPDTADPTVDRLRDVMVVQENERFTREYLEADKRSIGNSVQVFFKDGTATDCISVEYPIGHRRRRDEGIPVLVRKFAGNMRVKLSEQQATRLDQLCADQESFEAQQVDELMAMMVVEES